MSGTANTKDCVRAIIGRKVIGVLFDALPMNRRDLSQGNKTLIFEDGTGFTFSDRGTFWLENASDIDRAIAKTELELRLRQSDLKDVLAVAGALGVDDG